MKQQSSPTIGGTVRRMRPTYAALFIFMACIGALYLSGCSNSDDTTRATAVADEAAAALNESISIETSASRLILSIQMAPEFGLKPPDARKLGAAGLKTLDEADGLRAAARKKLETAQGLYASIDGMDTPDDYGKWVGMVALFADKWGEVISHDEADSALRRKALNMLVDGTFDEDRKQFGAIIDEIYTLSVSGQTVTREANRLSDEADGFAKSLE